MMSLNLKLAFVALCTSVTADFLTPTFPQPRDLSSQGSLVAAAWQNLTKTVDAFLKAPQTNTGAATAYTGLENLTFSASLFSLLDPAATSLKYDYTAPDVATAPNGTHKVDSDSIYKVASVSKLITAYTAQLKLSVDDWNRPVTDFLPELQSNGSDVINDVQWENITPYALATQQAGIPPFGLPVTDLLVQDVVVTPGQVDLGLPILDLSVFGPCANATEAICPVDQFLPSEGLQPPIFEPFTTPVYSDAAFYLLGLVIEKAAGKPIAQVYDELVFKPLNMTSSTGTVPTDQAEIDRGVITSPNWSQDGKYTIPSGGIFSTVNDLAKFGIGILNCTSLSPEETRKWMKPATFTPSLTYSFGAPWEIIRYVNPSGKITDIYGKLGDSGEFGAYIAMIPDYNAGFVMANTAAPSFEERSPLALALLDGIAETIMPALEAQAAAEAQKNYVGTYVSTDSALNSSVTVAFNQSTVPDSVPSLTLTSWISNGTEILASPVGVSTFGSATPRLLPTIIDHDGCRVAFYATGQNQSDSYIASPFATGPYSGLYSTNFDSYNAGQALWGNKIFNEMVFDVDKDGKATAITPSAARVKLVRQ